MQELNHLPDRFTIREAAQALGVSKETLRRAVQSEVLKSSMARGPKGPQIILEKPDVVAWHRNRMGLGDSVSHSGPFPVLSDVAHVADNADSSSGSLVALGNAEIAECLAAQGDPAPSRIQDQTQGENTDRLPVPHAALGPISHEALEAHSYSGLYNYQEKALSEDTGLRTTALETRAGSGHPVEDPSNHELHEAHNLSDPVMDPDIDNRLISHPEATQNSNEVSSEEPIAPGVARIGTVALVPNLLPIARKLPPTVVLTSTTVGEKGITRAADGNIETNSESNAEPMVLSNVESNDEPIKHEALESNRESNYESTVLSNAESNDKPIKHEVLESNAASELSDTVVAYVSNSGSSESNIVKSAGPVAVVANKFLPSESNIDSTHPKERHAPQVSSSSNRSDVLGEVLDALDQGSVGLDEALVALRREGASGPGGDPHVTLVADAIQLFNKVLDRSRDLEKQLESEREARNRAELRALAAFQELDRVRQTLKDTHYSNPSERLPLIPSPPGREKRQETPRFHPAAPHGDVANLQGRRARVGIRDEQQSATPEGAKESAPPATFGLRFRKWLLGY